MNKKALLVIGGSFGVFVIIMILTIVDGSRTAAEQEARNQAQSVLYDPVEPVCSGAAVAETAVYTNDSGIHPIAIFSVFNTEALQLRQSEFPSSWQPETVSDIELVACTANDSVFVESCEYTIEDGSTGTIERYQLKTTITLYEAQTGTIIDTTEIFGSMPKECGEQETFYEGRETKTFQGGLATSAEERDWLQQFVERP